MQNTSKTEPLQGWQVMALVHKQLMSTFNHEAPYEDAAKSEQAHDFILKIETENLWLHVQDEQKAFDLTGHFDAADEFAKIIQAVAKTEEKIRLYKQVDLSPADLSTQLIQIKASAYEAVQAIIGKMVDHVAQREADIEMERR